MLDSLKFVQGAVSKKDFVPEMTHFKIGGGFIRSYNGLLSMQAPIALDIECMPNATQLIRAIDNCETDIAINITPTGRLSVRSGKFKALINCVTEGFADIIPEGDYIPINGQLYLDSFRKLLPFVGTDASRPWTNGVFMRNQSAYVTNNVILIQSWLGEKLPKNVNIPVAAIREVLRVSQVPVGIRVSKSSLSFHYESGSWIRTMLYSTDWPDVDAILSAEGTPKPLPENFFNAVEKIKHFVDNQRRIFIRKGRVSTHEDTEENGATHDVEIDAEGTYRIEMLASLQSVVKEIDLTRYPKPCPFIGDNLRGVIIGMR